MIAQKWGKGQWDLQLNSGAQVGWGVVWHKHPRVGEFPLKNRKPGGAELSLNCRALKGEWGSWQREGRREGGHPGGEDGPGKGWGAGSWSRSAPGWI